MSIDQKAKKQQEIIVFILFWPVKLIIWVLKDGSGTYGETSAQKFLREYRAQCEADTRQYQAKKAEKERLLNQANQLEAEARYGSDYTRRELKRQAERLRREAGKL